MIRMKSAYDENHRRHTHSLTASQPRNQTQTQTDRHRHCHGHTRPRKTQVTHKRRTGTDPDAPPTRPIRCDRIARTCSLLRFGTRSMARSTMPAQVRGSAGRTAARVVVAAAGVAAAAVDRGVAAAVTAVAAGAATGRPGPLPAALPPFWPTVTRIPTYHRGREWMSE